MAFEIFGNSRRRSVTMADIDSMGGLEFESFVGELLKSIGYSGVQVTKSSGDQGVDVVAYKDGKKYAIQCKNYSSPLNNKPIQEVTTGKAVYGCDIGVVLTNSTFNDSAIEAANATGTLLWDRRTLQKMLDQSPFSKNVAETVKPIKTQQAPCIIEPCVEQPVSNNPSKKEKPRSIVKFIIGIVLMVFNGLLVFAGLVTLLSSGFSGDDIGLFLFFLAFFLLGLFLVKKNKKDKAVRKAEAGSYSTYTPYNGQKIGWGVVIIALLFFFPVGFYLLYKKMSQYSNPSEVQRNSKTLKIWATVLMCLGSIYPVMSIAGALEASAAIMCFVALFPFGLLLNKRSKSLAMMYTALPTPHESQANAANTLSQNIEHKQDVMLSTSSPIGSVYTEYQYTAGRAETTYVTIHCKGCNAPNRVPKGSVVECEYCGSLVGVQNEEEPTMDNEEAAISKAFAVIQRLLESMDEVSDDLSDGFDRLTHAMETFPNRSMPLDVEMNRVSSCIKNFSGEAKRISAGIRAQVLIACDNLMTYDDASWEKVETEIEQFNEIKSTLAETISSMRSFRHSIDNLNVNAGFQTYRIKTAQIQLVKEIDQALTVLQSAMSDFAESLKTFRNAKFTSKTERINTHKQRGGRL